MPDDQTEMVAMKDLQEALSAVLNSLRPFLPEKRARKHLHDMLCEYSVRLDNMATEHQLRDMNLKEG